MKHFPFLLSALFFIPLTANAETVHLGAGSTKVTHLSKSGRVLRSYVTRRPVQVREVRRKKVRPQPVIASVTIDEPKAEKVAQKQKTAQKPAGMMQAKPVSMTTKSQPVIVTPKQAMPMPQQAITPAKTTKPVVEASAPKKGWGPSPEEKMEVAPAPSNNRGSHQGQPMGGDYRVRMNEDRDRMRHRR